MGLKGCRWSNLNAPGMLFFSAAGVIHPFSQQRSNGLVMHQGTNQPQSVVDVCDSLVLMGLDLLEGVSHLAPSDRNRRVQVNAT